MHGLFIAGTDTDVGKTTITALLAQQLHQQGLAISARKPIASGCDVSCNDAQRLAQATGEDEWLVCPHRFKAAVSPERAIRLEGKELTLSDLVNACTNSPNFTLVEGAGGLLSPLTNDANNADLAVALALPVLLVIANKVGCINHSLLTLEAMKTRQLTCIGIVANSINCAIDEDNIADLKNLTHLPIWAVGHQQTQLPDDILTFVKQCFSGSDAFNSHP
jgi:dethiobiotin synthetase